MSNDLGHRWWLKRDHDRDVAAPSEGLDIRQTVDATVLPVQPMTFDPPLRAASRFDRPATDEGPTMMRVRQPVQDWQSVRDDEIQSLGVYVTAPAAIRTAEQCEVLGTFHELLAGPTGDGGAKRGRGEKPSWKVDTSHWDRAQNHITRYLNEGERVDKDSGCHPLAHAAWRFLAIAYQDMLAAGLLPDEPAA